MLTTPARILRIRGAYRGLLISGFLSLLSMPALARENPSPVPDGFAECKARLEEQAVAAGVSRETASTVMASAEHLERVIELDRRQPEFTTTFADYLNRRVNEARVTRGRELLQEHQDARRLYREA